MHPCPRLRNGGSVTSAPAYALEEPGKGIHKWPWEKTGFSGVSGGMSEKWP